MSKATDDSIQRLVADLQPTGTRLAITPAILLWLAGSAGYVMLTTLMLGPLRPQALQQMIEVPRFAAEMSLGLLSLLGLGTAALRGAVPGLNYRLAAWFGAICGLLWLSSFIAGFFSPALEPSMSGKREHCALEAYLLSIPPLLTGIWLQSRRFMLQPVASTALTALSAGLMPAVLMQIACMYEPRHILLHHVLPVITVTAVTVATVVIWRRLRSPTPRG